MSLALGSGHMMRSQHLKVATLDTPGDACYTVT
jgi:hypothetical protein